MHKEYAQENTARIQKRLLSSATTGLSAEEAAKRHAPTEKKQALALRKKTFSLFFGTVLKNGSLPLVVLSFLLAFPYFGIKALFPCLLYILFLTVFFVLTRLSVRGMAAHKNEMLPRVRVMRDGKEVHILPDALVKGDLLLLSAGDILYTYAHIASSEPMKVFCQRGSGAGILIKHGGDCFDGTDEPFNSLRPGDIVRDGQGTAFVTFLADPSVYQQDITSETAKNHGKMCDIASRISFALSFLMLGVGFFRANFAAEYDFLIECVLLAALLIGMAGTVFHPLFFELLFLAKNKKVKAQSGGSFVSAADMEALTEVDTFVLSTRSMFRSAQYVTRYFETATGKRLSDGDCTNAELSLIAGALSAMKARCSLSMKEDAVLSFALSRTDAYESALYAKASDEFCTHSSYQTADGRRFSLVWGDAQVIIPGLVYFSEEGKTRLLDDKSKKIMLSGAKRLRKHGYLLMAFAETQTRNLPHEMCDSFADMKLLGFFALRKTSDEQAANTLADLKAEGKKVVFLHEEESVDWLIQEVQLLEGVPLLDGKRDSFLEDISAFAEDAHTPFCIALNLSSLQRAQLVHALENAGHTVAAYGESFADHRMMCAATAAIAPIKGGETVTPLVLDASSLRAEEHISSQVDSVKKAPDVLGSFGILTAALCASLVGRSMVALVGSFFGLILLPVGYYALIGILFDLLAFYAFAMTTSPRRYDGLKGLTQENAKNLSLFCGMFAASLLLGGIATYVSLHPYAFGFAGESFVFFALLLLLNVQIWQFSSVRHSFAVLLLPLLSATAALAVHFLYWFSGGVIGFSLSWELFFWALLPAVLLMAIAKGVEVYLKGIFKTKNFFDMEKEIL